MRKDEEGSAGILAKIRGIWLPRKIRRLFIPIRDKLVALVSFDAIKAILKEEGVSEDIPKIYSDISSSVGFDEFVTTICNAALIITNRLHVGVLGHMLNKRVVLIPGTYHKIEGVYKLSMSGTGSQTKLYK